MCKKSVKKARFHSIGSTIYTRPECRCLPYAGFLGLIPVFKCFTIDVLAIGRFFFTFFNGTKCGWRKISHQISDAVCSSEGCGCSCQSTQKREQDSTVNNTEKNFICQINDIFHRIFPNTAISSHIAPTMAIVSTVKC